VKQVKERSEKIKSKQNKEPVEASANERNDLKNLETKLELLKIREKNAVMKYNRSLNEMTKLDELVDDYKKETEVL